MAQMAGEDLQLFTTNYPRFQPSMGVPVRTSLGYPRYIRYRLEHYVREVTPRRDYFHAPDEEFTDRYLEQLNGYGVDAIVGRLREVADAAGDSRLVLMCFEDLTKPGNACHRTLLGMWLGAYAGLRVRELGPTIEPHLF